MNFEDVRKKKNDLAKRCGSDTLKKRKVERYRQEVKKEFSPDDEISMLKDALVCAMNAIALFHPEILENEHYKKLLEYYNKVEAKKLLVKEELGMLREGGTE